MLFNVSGDAILHNVKRELFLQMLRFDIHIEAKGFFPINLKFVMAVSIILKCLILISFNN